MTLDMSIFGQGSRLVLPDIPIERRSRFNTEACGRSCTNCVVHGFIPGVRAGLKVAGRVLIVSYE